MEENKVEVKVGGSASQLKEVMNQAKEQVLGFKESVEGINHTLASMKAAVAGIGEIFLVGLGIEKIAELARQAGEYGEEIEKASKRTGLAVETVQELQYWFKQGDVNAGEFKTSVQHLSVALEQAAQKAGPARDALAAVGINSKEIKSLNLEDVIKRIADAFAGSADGATKNAVAMALFGRAAADLVPLLDQGANGFEAAAEHARALGVVLSDHEVKALSEVAQKFKDVDAVSEVLKARFGRELAPVILQVATAFTDASKEGGPIQELFRDLGFVINQTVKGLSWVVEYFQLLGVAVSGSMDAVKTAITDGAAAGNRVAGEHLKHLDELMRGWDEFRDHVDSNPIPESTPFRKKGGGGSLEFHDSGEAQAKASALEQIDAAHARATLQIKMESLRDEKVLLEADQAAKKLDLATYYASELKITQDGLAAEREAIEAQLKAVASQEAAARKRNAGEAELNALKAKQIALEGQLEVIRNRSENAAIENNAKLLNATHALNLELAAETIDHQHKMRDADLAYQQQLLAQDVAMSRINAQQQFAIQRRLVDDEYQNARVRLLQQLALTEKTELAARQKLNDELELLQKDHDAKVAKIDQAAELERTKYSREATNAIKGDMASAIGSMMDGTKSLKDAFKDMAKSIMHDIDQIIAKKLVEELFGATGDGSSGSGGWLSGLMKVFDSTSTSGGRAMGGHVMPNSVYDVAEGGPELARIGNRTLLLTGSQGGDVTPNDKTMRMGGMAVHNTFIIQGNTDRRTQEQIAAQAGSSVARALRRNS